MLLVLIAPMHPSIHAACSAGASCGGGLCPPALASCGGGLVPSPRLDLVLASCGGGLGPSPQLLLVQSSVIDQCSAVKRGSNPTRALPWHQPSPVAVMLSNKKRPYDEKALPPGKRLRANIQDLMASNVLSAQRTQSMINDAAGSGASGLDDLVGPVTTNSARKLRRAMLKWNQWPSLYWAKVHVKDPKTQVEGTEWLAFQLPHEYIYLLAKLGDLEALLETTGLEPISHGNLAHCQAQAGCKLLPLGLWGDGVPCNWDRTESVDTFSLNLPGLTSGYRTLRLPITALSHKQLVAKSWDSIMEVVAWSLQYAAAGCFPKSRHDGDAWLHSDKRRKSMAGNPLGARAALVEVRGDWKFFAECFHMPAWNETAGICWFCRCTREEALLCMFISICHAM